MGLMNVPKKSAFGSWGQRRGGVPAHKRILGTNIIVDGFPHSAKSESRTFFLTHFHSDHYIGITRTWKFGTIYCSAITAALVQQEFGLKAPVIHVLPMYERVVLDGYAVTVPQNSIMWLVGALLYCGVSVYILDPLPVL
jgi:hypothetical protein